ncbi:hypothetical protein [Streptomyces gougerotii]|uniref:hypothetical protein n=1 Tax=Streptomyces gougerotii TaxID=53448 RepID=UPI001673F14A|nr:hypothetical protein [Streptomyces gougerotii]
MLEPPLRPVAPEACATLPPEGRPGSMFRQQRLYGYRVIVYVRAERLYLQSRSGADLTSHFPELQAAAANISEDLALDGDLVVLHEDRLDVAACSSVPGSAASGHAPSPGPGRRTS